MCVCKGGGGGGGGAGGGGKGRLEDGITFFPSYCAQSSHMV